MQEHKVAIELETGDAISAILSVPDTAAKSTGIVFAHGSSNDMNHPVIMATARGLAQESYPCLRFNFPYREMGKNSPDPDHRLLHALARAMDFLKAEQPCTEMIVAGKSLGARIAAAGAAQGDITPQGIIFLGYPLHAPGRKDRLRDAPLRQIRVPMLFCEGTRDPFCDLSFLKPVIEDIGAELEVIEGGDHGFDLPKSTPRPQEEVYTQVVGTCHEWLKRNIK